MSTKVTVAPGSEPSPRFVALDADEVARTAVGIRHAGLDGLPGLQHAGSQVAEKVRIGQAAREGGQRAPAVAG